MDQDIINIAFSTIMTIIGWLGKTLWDAVDNLKNDIKKIEIDLPSHYAKKDELESRFDKIEVLLAKIYDKLETKADK